MALQGRNDPVNGEVLIVRRCIQQSVGVADFTFGSGRLL